MNPFECNFVFFDVVGLSNPALSTEKQIKKIEKLNEFIKECPTFKNTPKEKRIVLPTGDGAAIGFTENYFLPLDLTIELHRKLNEHNLDKQWLEQILLHTGLHSDKVFNFTDLRDEKNVWGEGIIIAQRIMSKAPEGFILLSEEIGKKLSTLEKYQKIIYHAGFIQLKYQRIFIWYAYDDDFGRNDISEIQDLNVQFSEFSAKITEQKHYSQGDTVEIKIDFTGNLESGYFDIMLRAPKQHTFPDGKKDRWITDHETYSEGKGKLSGNVAKISKLYIPIGKDYPTGIYKVYVRMYDDLSGGRKSIIREKVETLYVA